MRIKNGCFVVLLLLTTCCFGQNKSLSVGVKLINNITDFESGTLSPGFGAQVVYRIKKHAGLESGLFYQTQHHQFFFYTPNTGTLTAEIAERWLALPLLYRFDSRIINAHLGIQLEYFMSWRNRNRNPSLLIESYSSEAARLGFPAGLSKTISLSKNWMLEPEARIIFYPRTELANLGFNIAVRRRLF